MVGKSVCSQSRLGFRMKRMISPLMTGLPRPRSQQGLRARAISGTRSCIALYLRINMRGRSRSARSFRARTLSSHEGRWRRRGRAAGRHVRACRPIRAFSSESLPCTWIAGSVPVRAKETRKKQKARASVPVRSERRLYLMLADKGPDDDALATTREGGCGVLTHAPPSDRDFPNKNPRRIFPRGSCSCSR